MFLATLGVKKESTRHCQSPCHMLILQYISWDLCQFAYAIPIKGHSQARQAQRSSGELVSSILFF